MSYTCRKQTPAISHCLPAGFKASIQSTKPSKPVSKLFFIGLQAVNTSNSSGFFSSYWILCFFAAQHWLHQPVQQLCSCSASVLARRWALLVPCEGRLLPCFARHERMWGKLPGAERADCVSHGRLWGLDKNYYCYPQVSCSQVLQTRDASFTLGLAASHLTQH